LSILFYQTFFPVTSSLLIHSPFKAEKPPFSGNPNPYKEEVE